MRVLFAIHPDNHIFKPSESNIYFPGFGGIRRFDRAGYRNTDFTTFANAHIPALDFSYNMGDMCNTTLLTGEWDDADTIGLYNGFNASWNTLTMPWYAGVGHHQRFNFDPFDPAYDQHSVALAWSDYYTALSGMAGRSDSFIWNGQNLSYTFTVNGIKFVVFNRYTGYSGGTFDDPLDADDGSGANRHRTWLFDQLNTSTPVVLISHTPLLKISPDQVITGGGAIGDSWQLDATHFALYKEIIEGTGSYERVYANRSVQLVISSHWHRGGIVQVVNNIPHYVLNSPIRTRATQNEADTQFANYENNLEEISEDAANDNCYYTFNIRPQVNWTPNGQKANIEVVDYDWATDFTRAKSFDTHSLLGVGT